MTEVSQVTLRRWSEKWRGAAKEVILGPYALKYILTHWQEVGAQFLRSAVQCHQYARAR